MREALRSQESGSEGAVTPILKTKEGRASIILVYLNSCMVCHACVDSEGGRADNGIRSVEAAVMSNSDMFV